MSEANLSNQPQSWSDKQRRQQEDIEKNIFYSTVLNGTAEQINFQCKAGTQHLVPINELNEIYYQPETGIILFFRMGLAQIKGRNLGKLYQYLRDRKILEIRDFGENNERLFSADALFISQILYESDNLRNLELSIRKAR